MTNAQAGLNLWVARVPAVEGVVGTGPVDLSIGSQALSAPLGFDVLGGSGAILDRAYRWFIDAAEKARVERERTEHYLGAVEALNNLAVWCMTRFDDASAGQQAYNALLEAERILSTEIRGFDQVRGGVLFNLGALLSEAGHRTESAEYLRKARELGVGVS